MAQFQHVGSCLASQTCWKQRKGVAWLVQDFLNGMGRVQTGAGISCGVIFFLHVLGIFTSRSGQIFVEKEQNLQTWKTTAVAKFISMNLTS